MPEKSFSPAIQGLRAISILAVIVFHFQPDWLVGGYVGVDIFFVISGFLITHMIERDLTRGSFSLVLFYKNRVLRLLPNLFAMIVATVFIGYWVLRPYDFFQYAKSLQFSAIYLTNMVFAKQQGYFDMSRDVKPLLHTWSLSIEEQFYLIFPVFMLLVFKLNLRWQLKSCRHWLLLGIALASYATRWRYTALELPSEGFFSFFGRVWEFIVGAYLVYLPSAWRSKLAQNPASLWLSLGLIAASLFALDEALPYSELLLLMPCFATAVVIACREQTYAYQWLGAKPLVVIGGMSYSLYLWHWPLMVGFHQSDFLLNTSVGLQTLCLFVATAVISYLAWRYIEEPIRQNKDRFSSKSVGAAVLGFGLFCASVGGYIYAKSGMEQRFPSYVAIAQNLAAFDFKAATGISLQPIPNCASEAPANAVLNNCSFGDKQATKRLLLLGDSHAGSWYPAFDAAAQTRHWQGTLLSLPGCPPLLGIQSWDGAKDICKPHFEARLSALLNAQHFDKVFLVAFWSMYSEGEPDKRPSHFISDSKIKARDAAASQQVLTTHLQETIDFLNQRGIEVVLIHTVPTLPKRIQDLPEGFSQSLLAVENRNRFMKQLIEPKRAVGLLSSLDPATVLCHQDICPTQIQGHYMYSDNNHISPATAAKLIPLVQSAL